MRLRRKQQGYEIMGNSRWGQSESDQPPAPRAPGWTASRWGQPEPEAPAQSTGQPAGAVPTVPPRSGAQRKLPADAPAAQEAKRLSASPAEPAAPFPLPHPQADQRAGQQRQQQSSAWLKTLEGGLTRFTGPHRAIPRKPRLRKQMLLRDLLIAVSALLVVVIILISVPGLRQQVLSFLPQPASGTAQQPTQHGVLSARSNIAGSSLKLDNRTYQMAQQDSTFWSVTVPDLVPGTYDLSIAAPQYTPATGRVRIQAQQESDVTAFLSLAPTYLMDLLSEGHNQITSVPLARGVDAGAQYSGASAAAKPLDVTITYRVVSLVTLPAPSALETGQASAPPATQISGVITPDILFTDAASSALVGEYRPEALPADHFLVALRLTIDSSGQAVFALDQPAVLKATTASGTAVTAPGGVSPDLALLFALARLTLEPGASGSPFTCLGLTDALANPQASANPEYGFFIGLGSSAHYFYRWGQLWTTNSAAHLLTPDLPQASPATLVLAQSLLDAARQGTGPGCK